MKSRILIYIFISLIFFGLMAPLIFKSTIDVFDEDDEVYFHYPTIIAFREQFPNLDLASYNSATTPLYHVTLAISSFVVGSEIVQLRLVNFIISLVCLLVIYTYLSQRGKTIRVLFFTLIIMLSPYFIGPAIRLSTDNMALLFAFLSIFSMDGSVYTFGRSVSTNILILFTVLTRQVYAWLIGAYLLINLQKKKFGPGMDLNWLKIVLPTLIPISGLVYFIFLWNGLTPPAFAIHTAKNLNLDAPIFVLSVFGLYSVFFFFWLFEIYKKLQPNWLPMIFLVVVGVISLLMHPVSNEYPVLDRTLGDRGGSLWLVASKLPNFLGSSVVFWIFLPIGLISLYIATYYLISTKSFVMVICFLLWLATSVINTSTYQKYYEPFIFFTLGYTLIPVETDEKWHYWLGPAVLLAGSIGITLTRFFL